MDGEGPLVALERCDDDTIHEATARAVEAGGLAKVVEGAATVLVKPNLVTLRGPSTGVTTDVRVVEAVVEHVQEHAPEARVVVGEGSAGDVTRAAFGRFGYVDMAERAGVELVDLNRAESVEVTIPEPFSAARRLRVARLAVECDALVSVAKLKVHSVTVASGCCKNMMGALPGRRWKLVVHAGAPRKLVDLVGAVTPSFGVIDGLVGNEVDEVRPHPVDAGVVLAGRDPVAVDAVGCRLMGIDVGDVLYLSELGRRGVGCADLSRIELTCEPEEAACRAFNRSLSPIGMVRTSMEQVYGFLLTRRSAR